MSTACLDVVDKVPAEEAEGKKPRVTLGISAEEHHRYLVALFRANNRVRREFIDVLLSLCEQKLYLKLGSPSIVQYAARHFGLKPSQTYECLRVAKALRELTLISCAFDRGEINWTVVKRITQVASERTQERWLEFCTGRTSRQIEAEVKEAQRKNRDRPRKEGDSMPTLRLRVSFELAPEEHDLVEKALGKVTSELGEKLGGGRLGSQRRAPLHGAAYAGDGSRANAARTPREGGVALYDPLSLLSSVPQGECADGRWSSGDRPRHRRARRGGSGEGSHRASGGARS